MIVAERTRPEVDASPDAGNRIGRYPGLDGIRGFALVMLLSTHFLFSFDIQKRIPGAAMGVLFRIVSLGWSTLDLFFVLSGFLITSILLASKREPGYFRKFYGRRAVRILPLYYTALVVGLVVAPALFGERWAPFIGDTPQHQLWLWTYLFNVAVAFGIMQAPGVFGPLWSLAIEEQYYLVWPWIVKYTSRAALGAVCATFVVASVAFRVAWWSAGLGWPGAYFFTLGRLDALAVGGAIALLVQDPAWRRRLDRWAPLGLVVGVPALVVLALRPAGFAPYEPFTGMFGHTILAFICGCFVLVAIRDSAPAWICSPWLRWLGTISYSAYVWHYFLRLIMVAIYDKYPVTSPVGGAIQSIAFGLGGMLLSVACGWISYVAFERPFLQLKRLFRYNRPAEQPTELLKIAPPGGARPRDVFDVPLAETVK